MATARQSLERDLHDGAQQRIVAALFELRRGERAALRAGEPALAQKLGSICALADRSLEQLRHVANGVHPHLLTSDGLETALVSLTDTTREPLSLSVRLDGALPPELEHNLYCIVSDVVGRSAHEGRGAVKDVEIMRADGMVVTRIRGTAVVVSGEVSDRVDAAGGWWAGGADEVRVELPCES
jgi:signal transduction histidine kinase